ncbi:unnamed protein product [Notodromas monacha]|uniref:SH2 domain-containing protein n=1 Tax=Notodromas monacha TaxID=399045 RepID=A0A7R9GCK1_9CRUS|nr:unnamed protein product [Notodromas monacha]CAG0917527.1 unnamed protein product [Notodromas monacha]
MHHANVKVFPPRWYFGKIKRIEAEKKLLMPNNSHGAFLIRDSESRRNDYSLSGESSAEEICILDYPALRVFVGSVRMRSSP